MVAKQLSKVNALERIDYKRKILYTPHLLAFCIQSRRSLIKKQNLGIADQRSSNGYSLLLSS